MKIALVAACDRNNFGDILLPIIAEDYFNTHAANVFEFEYFALSTSDLSNVGGRPTKPMRKINNTHDVVIIAGGEVLTSQYFNMFTNLLSNRLLINTLYQIRRVSVRVANELCKLALHGKNELPWSFFSIDENQCVIYNAVGGSIALSSQKHQHEMLTVAHKSDFFAIRDRVTYQSFVDLGGDSKIKLIPDTAIIMAELYEKALLRTKCTNSIVNMVKQLDSYFVIQINKSRGIPIISDIAVAINTLYESTGMRCVLLPIGRAEGHEDMVPLQLIHEQTNKNASILVQENNIYDVMYIIAHAKGYLGTSLHGAICAASYGVPHTAITNSAIKLIRFLETWNTTTIPCVNGTNEIVTFVETNKNCESVNIEKIETMKTSVKNLFNEEIVYLKKNFVK